MPDPEPALVAQTVTRPDRRVLAPLVADWLGIEGDRAAYARALRPLLAGHRIAVLIVRGNGFTNSNNLMVDLVRLLEDNRPEFERVLGGEPPGEHVGLVLLARGPLKLAQGPSPAIWPDWVSEVGGQEVYCQFTDLTHSVEASLAAAEVDVPRLHRALHALELAVVRRLAQTYDWTPEQHEPLRQHLAQGDPAWGAVLAAARSEVDGVGDRDTYRPAAAKNRTTAILARLWTRWRDQPSRDLGHLAQALGTALHLDGAGADCWQCVPVVLTRQREPVRNPAQRFGHTLIVTAASALQYVTCAAHADHYRHYPVVLLSSLVTDLHRGLRDLEQTLNHLPGRDG
ncbi:hypothetical protein JOF53_001127 [Crossiella equi]|uniref:Uncharacterized protein n=1 Tax=Crossiella equi TaxID=130796 RepID=A0ABS5A953_9PSEU|nr:hypothetical protein [Crossiella equi]MBP2472255.1 hypothetical protein [Crossiella equi]